MIREIFIFVNIIGIFGYNVDTDYASVYYCHDSTAYCGYSVLLHAGSNGTSWLFIGAPRANYTTTSKTKRYPEQPGLVYRCTIGKKCQTIGPDKLENEEGYLEQVKMKMVIKKQYGWFGSVMAVERISNLLTICAPRTIMTIFNPYVSPDEDTMHGVCYSGHVNSNTLSMEAEDIATYDFSAAFWYSPLHGFSIDYPTLRNGYKDKRDMYRIVGEPKHEDYGTVNIHHSNKKLSVELPIGDALSQFGYSVTSGYFFKPDELLYAGGAPGWHYMGQVGVINPLLNTSFVAMLHGHEFGEFFGASLATGDLNNDGLDDLVVGAPHWGQDNGRVYAYIGTPQGHFELYAQLEGEVEEAYFGYSIACGDLDMDGFSDIIVGAPWEDSGVIYIFNGAENLKGRVTFEMRQRISVEDLSKRSGDNKIEGFGFSISEPVDIDGNGYLDFAVGGYKSGHAVILRSRPVVRTNITIQTIPSILQRDAKEFFVKVCPEYKGYPMRSVDFRIAIKVDERYKRTKETSLELRSSGAPDLCVNTSITILDNVQDFIEPIGISARHDFAYKNVSSSFCETCPVESLSNKLKVAFVLLPFDIGCGEDRMCNSNITASAKFHGVRDNDTWVIGSNDVSLQVTLRNDGEPAYLTSLVFDLPEGIVLRSILPSCQEDVSGKNLTVTCDVGNPIGEKEEKTIKLDLDMRHLSYGSLHGQKLNFLITIRTRSANRGTMEVTKELELVSEVSVSLNGKSSEQSYYLPVISTNSSNVTFQHTYQVYKLGATPIEEARLVVKIPRFSNDTELVYIYEPLFYVSGELFQCTSSSALLRTETIEVEGEPFLDEFNLSARMVQHGSRVSRAFHVTNLNESTVKESLSSSKANVVYFNCSTPGVHCATVVCDLGGLKTLQDVGKILMNFVLNVKALKGMFEEDRKVLRFVTEATVEIDKPRRRLSVTGTRSSMEISTLFHSTPKAEELRLWIILVSVSVGLLLLLLLAAVLSTMGFFKRSRKQELNPLPNNEVSNGESKEAAATSKTEAT